MSKFRPLSEQVMVSPQIEADDLGQARELGVALVVNNRPEGEEPGQPTGDEIKAAASQAGLDYRAIPVGREGFTDEHVAAMAEALNATQGKILAYCRSGTRSTFLWALAQASRGEDTDALARSAASAGYDLSPIRAFLDNLSRRPPSV